MKTLGNNLIRALVIIGMVMCGLPLQAQVSFGIKAGLNVNNISQDFKVPADEYSTKLQAGYHVGILADIQLGEIVSVQPGVMYISKGYNHDLSDKGYEGFWPEGASSFDGYDRMRLGYIEVPVNLAFRVIEDLQLYAGPYAAIGVGGKNKWDVTYSIDDFEESDADEMTMVPKFGEVGLNDLDAGEMAYQGLDYGFNVGAMYYFGPVFVNAAYSHGLGNITTDVVGGPERRTQRRAHGQRNP
jgi:hypothetical protein